MTLIQIIIAVAISAGCLLLVGVIAREVFYAVNPDRRPRKRKRRERHEGNSGKGPPNQEVG